MDNYFEKEGYSVPKPISKYKTYGKVFFYFAIGIIIAGLVSLLFSNILYRYAFTDLNKFYNAYIIILGVSALGMFITTLVIRLFSFKTGSGMIIPYILYSFFMGGILTGSLVFIGDPNILGTAFLVTALLFLLIGIVTILLGNKIKFIFVLLIGLIMGIGLLSLFNFLLLPFILINGEFYENFKYLYFLLEIGIFLVTIIYTAVDLWRLNRAANTGAEITTNYALYLALNLLTDFIYIFIRIAVLIARLRRR